MDVHHNLNVSNPVLKVYTSYLYLIYKYYKKVYVIKRALELVSEPDPQKIEKEGLVNRLG